MAPFRASRSTRSGRPGGQNDTDVFDGLPVRQWRMQNAALTGGNEEAPAPDIPARGQGIWKELPMPKDSVHYKPWCQQILRAARLGRILTSPQTIGRNGKLGSKEEERENDTEVAVDGNGEDANGNGKRARSPEQGFMAKRWMQTARNLEEADFEYLAKRRKGLPSLNDSTAALVVAPPPVYAGPMRKTKVKRVDAAGMATIFEVLVPTGESVEGEITGELSVENAATLVSAPPPGTVIEGLGVTNEEGVVVANILPAPLASNNPMPRQRGPRKKTRGGFRRGRGRRLGHSEGRGGFSASAEALYAAQGTGLDDLDTTITTVADDGAGEAPVGVDDEDDEGEVDEDDDADIDVDAEADADVDDADMVGGDDQDGEGEGDDDEDREEGELTPSPDPPDVPAISIALSADPNTAKSLPATILPTTVLPSIALSDLVPESVTERASSPELPLPSATNTLLPYASNEPTSEAQPGALPTLTAESAPATAIFKASLGTTSSVRAENASPEEDVVNTEADEEPVPARENTVHSEALEVAAILEQVSEIPQVNTIAEGGPPYTTIAAEQSVSVVSNSAVVTSAESGTKTGVLRSRQTEGVAVIANDDGDVHFSDGEVDLFGSAEKRGDAA